MSQRDYEVPRDSVKANGIEYFLSVDYSLWFWGRHPRRQCFVDIESAIPILQNINTVTAQRWLGLMGAYVDATVKHRKQAALGSFARQPNKRIEENK